MQNAEFRNLHSYNFRFVADGLIMPMHNLLLRPANLKQTCSWQDKDGNTPLHYVLIF